MKSRELFAIKVFSVLMEETISPGFVFPKGGEDARTVTDCMERLEERYGTLSCERIVDFCVTQVYAVQQFGYAYLKRWKPSHSFGIKALERYRKTGAGKRYYEDRWLKEKRLTREELVKKLAPRREHPFATFVNPAYEERTKRRLLSTVAGYYVCGVSTMLWNPFSPSCSKCGWVEKCKLRTAARFPEIYRLRIEKSGKGRVNGNE